MDALRAGHQFRLVGWICLGFSARLASGLVWWLVCTIRALYNFFVHAGA